MEALLELLKDRFEKNMIRHKGLDWAPIATKLRSSQTAFASLEFMEKTGGEPDVVGTDPDGRIIFVDCSAESPAGRRSLCYDDEALNARKENKPAGSAMGLASQMGVDLLTEAEYRHLQTLGAFDLKTSSWLLTPAPIRKLGGALFGDRRFDTVFTYHNGVQSYYAARGFRAKLLV